MTVKSCKLQACNAITRPEVLCSSWSQQFLSPRGATERLDQLQKLKTEVGTNWTENLGEDPTVENWCRKERWRDSNGFNMIIHDTQDSSQFPDQTRVKFDISGPFQVRFRAFYGWCSLARCSSEAEQLEIPFLRGLEVLPYEEVPWGFVLRLPYVHQVPVMLRERLSFWRLSCCGAHTPAKKSWFSHFCVDKSAKELQKRVANKFIQWFLPGVEDETTLKLLEWKTAAEQWQNTKGVSRVLRLEQIYSPVPHPPM